MVRMGDLKYVWRMEENDELYDLEKDPLETRNQIANPDYRDHVTRLRERLLRHLIETGDRVPEKMDSRF